MKRNRNSERREFPRIDQQLPINVRANGYDFATDTRNVSCVGAYCRVNKYMPPFTRVMVKLTLPIVTAGENKNYSLECKGVVVRTEDESKGGFNIAIFFNEIRGEQRKRISQYVNQFLPR